MAPLVYRCLICPSLHLQTNTPHDTHTNQRDKHQATPPLNVLPHTEHTGFTEKFLDKRKDWQLHEQKWESANSVNSV